MPHMWWSCPREHHQHHLLCQVRTTSNSADELSSSRESRDSGVSTGSSQDCGELTPTLERPISRPTQAKDKVQFCQLVRKLSEVEGISPTSILRSMKTSSDEGVELEGSECGSGPVTESSLWTESTSNSQCSSMGGLSSEEMRLRASSSGSSGLERLGEAGSWSQSLPSCQGEESEPGAELVKRGGAARYNPILPGHQLPPSV